MNRGHLESLRPLPGSAVPPDAGRSSLLAAGFVAGYLALDWVSFIHPMQQYGITPWNPQPALAIALLLRGGQRWLPVVFVGVLLAECVVRGASPVAPSALLIAAVLTLGYAAIARALSGRFQIDPALDSGRDVVRLVGVGAGGALLTGVLYIAALLAGGQGPLHDPFLALIRFWVGDAIGILVTLPVVLMLSVPTRRAEMLAALRGREAAVHAAAIALALGIVFVGLREDPLKFFYILFLPLIFTATRYGLAGSALAVLLIQAAVIFAGEVAGLGTLTVLEFQALLIALTVTGLFLGVTVDERRRAQDELRRSMRLAAAGEMAAALAHELNQPLTAVASYARSCELIAASPAEHPGRLNETLAKLVAESTRAADVVRRLRDFFRTGATRLETVDLRTLAERVLGAARANAAARGVTCSIANGAGPCLVLADEIQIEVVLRNLVANAVEAAALGPAPREVRLEVRAAPRSCEVTVEDTGGGVREADAERIFEAFETGRATGMGIGLAISRAIVEAHGGRVWAEAGPRGRFHLTLPGGPDERH
jgi:two-component system sensor kinase FixL